VLTFDVTGISNFQPVNQAYGDNVTAVAMGAFSYGADHGFTPDITVSYGDTNPALWTTGYGTLSNVLFEDQDFTGVLNVNLLAAANYEVKLHSFDLAAFTTVFSTDPVITSVRIFDAANVELFSVFSLSVSRATFTPFMFSTPLQASSLRIEVDARNLTNLNDDIAIDNIAFSQALAPEPSTSVTLLAGLILLVRRRK
jgi:hypothetical protein